MLFIQDKNKEEKKKMKNNMYFLDGYILGKPELKVSSKNNETKYCRGSISVRGRKKQKNGYYESTIFNFTAFNQTAEYICKYCDKGTRVNMWGELGLSHYTVQTYDEQTGEAKDRTIYSVELNCNDIAITSKSNRAGETADQSVSEIPTEKENTEEEKAQSEQEWYEANKATPETIPGLYYDDNDENW